MTLFKLLYTIFYQNNSINIKLYLNVCTTTEIKEKNKNKNIIKAL